MLAYRVALWCSAAVLVVVSSLVSATSQRTFVASTGVDNPNCQITTPCRSFTAAITATSPSGEIIVQDSAGYGKVTITKSVSIIAPPGIYAGITVFPGNDGITVNAPASIVVLRGLSINGQGGDNGILVQAAAGVRVENCVVSNMAAVGIYHQANNAEMIVLDTIARDNRDGIALAATSASITLDHVRSEHNFFAGFYTAPAGPSLVRATISDSVLADNGQNGIWAEAQPSGSTLLVLVRSTVTGNQSVGLLATANNYPGAYVSITVARNTFSGNAGTAILAQGNLGQIVSSISENAVSDETITADGPVSVMRANGTTGTGTLTCSGGATLESYGDNRVSAINVPACTFSVVGGK